MTHSIRISVGDWSNDGHGQYECFDIDSNKTLAELDAIDKTCKARLGFETGDIAYEYEEPRVRWSIVDSLIKAGYVFKDEDLDEDYDPETYEDRDDSDKGGLWVTAENCFYLWMHILQFLDPTFEFERLDENIPTLRSHIGYGCFGS